MKIFAICLIKNEIDIIEYCLKQSLRWADKIIVYDNGSTDGTWELVTSLAKEDERIIAWKSEARPYSDGLRAEAFAAFRHLAKEGDWWCFILDADEIYIEDPKTFLPKVPWIYHVVKTISLEYKLTFEDVEEYKFEDNFNLDVEKIKYYSPRAYSEKRFFRHRDRIVWPFNEKFPNHIGVTYSKGIMLKHFQYRSPQQVQRRVLTRIQATKDGYQYFGRDNVASWKDKLVHRNELLRETPEYNYKEIKDVNFIPWYWQIYYIITHALKIYP